MSGLVIPKKKKNQPIVAATPVSDRVIVRRDPVGETTPGGIVIPDASTEKSVYGTVLAIGPGRHIEGNSMQRHIMQVKVGDRVILPHFAASDDVKIGEEDGLVVVREGDILAILH